MPPEPIRPVISYAPSRSPGASDTRRFYAMHAGFGIERARLFLHADDFRRNRELESTRVGDVERAAVPRRVVRLSLELHSGSLGARGEFVDVLRRTDMHAHADTLL